MCRPRTKCIARLIAAAIAGVALGTILGGCSDIYYDRRDTIALGAADAVAANEIAQMVDPWPAQSGNSNVAFNGQKMQSAVERYRTNKVTPPADTMALQVAPVPPTAQPSMTSTPPVPSIAPGTTTTTTTVVTAPPAASASSQ
jgi:hypothetical protein